MFKGIFGINWPQYLPVYIPWITSTNLFLSFRFDWNIIECLLVSMYWLYYHFSMLKLILGCVMKFSVGHIQTGHMDVPPLKAWGSSWQGCQLGDHTCSHQLSVMIWLNNPSSPSTKTYFVDCWHVFFHWSYHHFSIHKLVFMCLRKQFWPYPNLTYRFSPSAGFRKFVAKFPVVWLYLPT